MLYHQKGSTHRYLSKYHKVYNDYLKYKNNDNDNEDNDTLKSTIKQYILPTHMFYCNICMIQRHIKPILKEIKSHRELFGDSSYVIIHAFSNGGGMLLCNLNDAMKKSDINNNQSLLGLYYDGIIYDSTDCSSMSIISGFKALWKIMQIKLISRFCICFDTLLCKIWSFILYCIIFLIAIIIIPICFLLVSFWIIITCASDYIFCYDRKLMGHDDIKLLAIPTLLLGSNKDELNPINKSIEWLNDRRDKLENKLMENEQPNEESVLLKTKYNDGEFIKDSNRFVEFEESEHVKHYPMYPHKYQQEVNKFLDLCLN